MNALEHAIRHLIEDDGSAESFEEGMFDDAPEFMLGIAAVGKLMLGCMELPLVRRHLLDSVNNLISNEGRV